MAVSTPKDAVFYYECSKGAFRLVYFIPPLMLKKLVEQDHLSSQVLKDFPDGVDLTCRESDFEEFYRTYGYRPKFSPDELNQAFFAILSTTRDWEHFRGSGFIPDEDIERHVKIVNNKLRQKKLLPEDIEPLPDRPTLRQRRKWIERKTVQRARVHSYLEKIRIEGIDSKQSLRQQRFSPIKMHKGKSAQEIFSSLQEKRKR